MLTSASNFKSLTVSAKLIFLNRFLRVDERLQDCFNFHSAQFVTKSWCAFFATLSSRTLTSFWPLMLLSVWYSVLAFSNSSVLPSILAENQLLLRSSHQPMCTLVSPALSLLACQQTHQKKLGLDIAHCVAQRDCHHHCFRQ